VLLYDTDTDPVAVQLITVFLL